MGRPQSPETRQKISEGVKRAVQARRDANNPTTVRRRELTSAFSQGHPAGHTPRIRNLGGLGKDVQLIQPQSRVEREREATMSTQAHRDELLRTAADRARVRQQRHEGVNGGTAGIPEAPKPSRTQAARQTAAEKRARLTNGG